MMLYRSHVVVDFYDAAPHEASGEMAWPTLDRAIANAFGTVAAVLRREGRRVHAVTMRVDAEPPGEKPRDVWSVASVPLEPGVEYEPR